MKKRLAVKEEKKENKQKKRCLQFLLKEQFGALLVKKLQESFGAVLRHHHFLLQMLPFCSKIQRVTWGQKALTQFAHCCPKRAFSPSSHGAPRCIPTLRALLHCSRPGMLSPPQLITHVPCETAGPERCPGALRGYNEYRAKTLLRFTWR